MLISTSEDGIGTSTAERILNKRREQEIVRRNKKIQNTRVSGMEEVAKLSNFVYQTRNMRNHIEDLQIRMENSTETKRLKALANESPEKMVVIPGEKVWYTETFKETKDPEKAIWGFSEIRFVPKRAKYDAMCNVSYSALLGQVGINFNLMEEHMDKIMGNFTQEEFLQIMSC